MENKKRLKNTNFFYCNSCDFTCCKRSDYNRHIQTLKHHRKLNGNKKNADLICQCGKQYVSISGLWKHNKKCDYKPLEINNINNNSNNNKIITNDLIIKLIEQNEKLQNQIIELSKEKQIITNNNCNNNNNNKTFNLQLFLNETCKNAMNLNQFVNNIDITMDDLKNTRINGLVEGVSNIIIRGLKQLEVHERPIHCTDLKRDTLYIKDNEKWTKDENNEIFKETIEEIIEKEQYALNMWTDAHPDWDKVTHLQDEYVLMVNRLYQPVMEDEKKEKKIIHNISKEVYIQK
jgi:hypothetical protein